MIFGQGVAGYRRERNRDVNTTRIIFRWTAAGFVLGWLVLLVSALV